MQKHLQYIITIRAHKLGPCETQVRPYSVVINLKKKKKHNTELLQFLKKLLPTTSLYVFVSGTC